MNRGDNNTGEKSSTSNRGSCSGTTTSTIGAAATGMTRNGNALGDDSLTTGRGSPNRCGVVSSPKRLSSLLSSPVFATASDPAPNTVTAGTTRRNTDDDDNNTNGEEEEMEETEEANKEEEVPVAARDETDEEIGFATSSSCFPGSAERTMPRHEGSDDGDTAAAARGDDEERDGAGDEPLRKKSKTVPRGNSGNASGDLNSRNRCAGGAADAAVDCPRGAAGGTAAATTTTTSTDDGSTSDPEITVASGILGDASLYEDAIRRVDRWSRDLSALKNKIDDARVGNSGFALLWF